jgi:hypothetical protein
MRDTARYARFWPLGEVAHPPVVRRDLAAIDLRHRKVTRRLT